MCFNLQYTLKKVKIVGKKFSNGEVDEKGLLSEEVERWKSQQQQQQKIDRGSHSLGDDDEDSMNKDFNVGNN